MQLCFIGVALCEMFLRSPSDGQSDFCMFMVLGLLNCLLCTVCTKVLYCIRFMLRSY